jgi:hypothetical protein
MCRVDVKQLERSAKAVRGRPGRLTNGLAVLRAPQPHLRVGYRRGVPTEASPGRDRVRTAEVAATLCLATDLGMGFPFEQGLHSTLVAMRLADRLGVDDETASQTYYACLLMYSGCTTTPTLRLRPSGAP